MAKRFDVGGNQPLGLARFLSWISLALILTSSMTLSVVIANSARETLILKQQKFALLLAENLNHQIYRRFTLPTLVGFGRIALRQPVQYERLDQIVQSIIHGLHVQRLRIYDHSQVVSYSTDKEDLGRGDLAPVGVAEALQGDEPDFEIVSPISFWQALFILRPEPGTFILRTLYPLRIENRLNSSDAEGPIMGVLELTQDITDDYRAVIGFQWLIITSGLVSSVVLFAMLLVFIRRAERLISERVTEKQRLERELHQHEKLASMGRVIASIAHEIRNPLGIIQSSAELLRKRANGGDAMTGRILEAIYDEARRLGQTVNDFLDYARPRTPRQDPVELDVVLNQVLGFLDGELTRADVTVERTIQEGLVVPGDKDLLYRAFYNIMVNALQAMDGPGAVNINCVQQDDTTVTVEFADSGPGFDQTTRTKLLDPFFTTKDHGTGLGLPIVNSIITSHGGRLELDDAPGGGALVRVLLPCYTE